MVGATSGFVIVTSGVMATKQVKVNFWHDVAKARELTFLFRIHDMESTYSQTRLLIGHPNCHYFTLELQCGHTYIYEVVRVGEVMNPVDFTLEGNQSAIIQWRQNVIVASYGSFQAEDGLTIRLQLDNKPDLNLPPAYIRSC